MEVKRCSECGREMPADHEPDLCSLCAIGLTPTQSPPAGAQPEEGHRRVIPEGRMLSGVDCPTCHAQFSLADIKHLSCAICGERFTAERMALLLRQAEAKLARIAGVTFKDTGLGRQDWPEDAPIW